MSLPSAWIDRIFGKLAVTYGQRFLGLYAGIDIGAVKDDWADELAGYEKNPDAIKHALGSLPTDRPPTVLEFRALCRAAPRYADTKLLEGPKTPPPPGLVDAVASIGKGCNDWKQWAHDLKAREQRDPKRLTAAQRWMWREALGEQQEAKTA